MSHIIFFFFNDTATTEIYTLSLHDALPIYGYDPRLLAPDWGVLGAKSPAVELNRALVRRLGSGESLEQGRRSEEHTSELQSRQYLVCRLLLEKKKNTQSNYHPSDNFNK